jgi:hypothetical protein
MHPKCTPVEVSMSPLDLIDQLFFLLAGIYVIYVSKARKERYSERRARFLRVSGIVVIALAVLMTAGDALRIW